jgi:hypothetical protein
MKRDMDVVRRIVLAVADSKEPQIREVEGIPEDVFAAHAQWLEEAGLLEAALPQGKRTAHQAIVFRLTWAGCDFADAVRSDTLWAKAKEKVIAPSASWTFGILLDWLKGQIASQLLN